MKASSGNNHPAGLQPLARRDGGIPGEQRLPTGVVDLMVKDLVWPAVADSSGIDNPMGRLALNSTRRTRPFAT